MYQLKLVYTSDCLRVSRALKRNVANWVCTVESGELSKEYMCLTG